MGKTMSRDEIILEMMKNPPLGPDDKFRFYCTACGDCCYDPEGIVLSAGDVFRGAKFLGMDALGFVNKYCDRYVGGTSHLPILTLKMEGRRHKCVFLDARSNKCKIRPAKPAVCEVYPLGRNVDLGELSTVEYRLQPLTCGKRCKEYTVRQWLSGTGIEKSNELFIAWSAGVQALMERTKRLYDLAGEELISLMAPQIALFLYFNYDMDKEFLPQLKENCKNATALLDKTEEFVREEIRKMQNSEE